MRRRILRKFLLEPSLLVLTVALSGAAPTAQAADLPVYQKTPPPVDVWNPWMIRIRALAVLPDASGSSVNVLGVPTLSSPTSGLSISNSVVPEGAVAELVGIEVGVVSGVINLESSGVEASDWRLRHEQAYHEARFLAACD